MRYTRVLIDGLNAAHGLRHALSELYSERGRPTGVLFGMLRTIDKLLDTFSPDEITVVWEEGVSWRSSVFPGYKEERIQRIKEMHETEVEAYGTFKTQQLPDTIVALRKLGIKNCGAQIGKKSQFRAQAQQTLLGSNRYIQGFPLGSPHGAQQYRIRLPGILQGGLAGFAFWVVGIPSSVFWAAIMTVLSIIPGIGTALVWGPAAIILAASGHIAKGVGLAVFCAIVVGSIDNLLRPKLVGKDTQMHELMIFFGTLGGIVMFGVMGIIIGPIVAALFVTIWDIYGVVFADILPDVGSVLKISKSEKGKSNNHPAEDDSEK